jgi:RecB family exonuclease
MRFAASSGGLRPSDSIVETHRSAETTSVFHERFEAAAQRVPTGDDPVMAAQELECAVLEDYPGDHRLDDLHEALARYAH